MALCNHFGCVCTKTWRRFSARSWAFGLSATQARSTYLSFVFFFSLPPHFPVDLDLDAPGEVPNPENVGEDLSILLWFLFVVRFYGFRDGVCCKLIAHHLLRCQFTCEIVQFFCSKLFSFEQGENLTWLVPTFRDSPMSALAAFSLSDMTDAQSRRVEGRQSLDNKDLQLKDKLNNKDVELKDELNNKDLELKDKDLELKVRDMAIQRLESEKQELVRQVLSAEGLLTAMGILERVAQLAHEELRTAGHVKSNQFNCTLAL